MSADGSVTLVWGDGEHRFRLAIGQLRELQSKCEAGPVEILDRLTNRRWRVDDVRETIRLGLIGGGMTPVGAHALVQRYVDARPLMESVLPATTALYTALIGDPDDAVGKAEPEEATTDRPTTADALLSPGSTEAAPFSASLPRKSMQ